MKKFVSLLLTVVLLATMFCVFSIPASAQTVFAVGSDEYYECSLDETGNTLLYKLRMIPLDVNSITSDMSEINSGLYVVDSNISLEKRPIVKGNVGIILKNGATLTANYGITVEEGNTLNIYAQTEDENAMGKLIVDTEGVTAIGGRNGGNGGNGVSSDPNGKDAGSGGNGGNINFHGGKISLKTSGVPCIGGGKGGNGGDGIKSPPGKRKGGNGGAGGNGGNGANVCFFSGNITLKNEDNYCLGGSDGGNGGNANQGSGKDGNAGRGGKGGNTGIVSFLGGNVLLQSDLTACIGVGFGGAGGQKAPKSTLPDGSNGSNGVFNEGFWNVLDSAAIVAGTSAEAAGEITEYGNEPYLSVKYDKDTQSVQFLVPLVQLEDYQNKYRAKNIPIGIYCGDGLKGDFQNGTLTISGNGSIGDYAFFHTIFVELQSVVIEEGVTGIGDYAFMSTELLSVKIPASVQYIGNYAFADCYDLSSATIGNGSLKTIGNEAFSLCKGLSQIIIPAGVESIGSKCFAKSGLLHITFLGDCKIGEEAFLSCGWYQEFLKITIPSNWTQGTDTWYGEYESTYENAGIGSTLSEGSLTVICSVAAAVVFGLGGFFIGKAAGKKKKSAAEDNAEKDEE